MFLRILPIFSLSLAFLMPVAAADTEKQVPERKTQATVKIAESEEYGKYLTDGKGRALYLFTADKRGKGGAGPKVACTSESCLEGWPPLYSQDKPGVGKGVDASKLDTITFRGRNVVTYNGWPLYYFVQDGTSGKTRGQDVHAFDGEWYLVTPKGNKAEG